MGENYPAGTVAVATVRGVPNVRVFRLSEGYWAHAEEVAARVEGVFRDISRDVDVSDVRPLIVLDIGQNDGAVLARYLRSHVADIDSATLHSLADQIEAQTRPPKPSEPAGLGAVVVDRDGHRWVRIDSIDGSSHPWESLQLGIREYADIDAVEVLSEGVQ